MSAGITENPAHAGVDLIPLLLSFLRGFKEPSGLTLSKRNESCPDKECLQSFSQH